jgi:hypothetical protein
MPRDWGILFRRTSGVLPICCVMVSMTTGGIRGFVFVDMVTVNRILCLYVVFFFMYLSYGGVICMEVGEVWNVVARC